MYIVCITDTCGWSEFQRDLLPSDDPSTHDCLFCGGPVVFHTISWWLDAQSRALHASIAADAAAGAGGSSPDGENTRQD